MKELHDCIFHLFKVSSHDAAKFGKNLYNRSSDINLGPGTKLASYPKGWTIGKTYLFLYIKSLIKVENLKKNRADHDNVYIHTIQDQ